MDGTDEITLTIPREPDFHRVAHLVLGGLAVRLDLTIENLEDMQIALDAILDNTDPNAGEITVRMRLHEGELETSIGPLTAKVRPHRAGAGRRARPAARARVDGR